MLAVWWEVYGVLWISWGLSVYDFDTEWKLRENQNQSFQILSSVSVLDKACLFWFCYYFVRCVYTRGDFRLWAWAFLQNALVCVIKRETQFPNWTRTHLNLTFYINNTIFWPIYLHNLSVHWVLTLLVSWQNGTILLMMTPVIEMLTPFRTWSSF